MNNYYHEIKLPGVTIPGNLFLAPIAGFSDAPFRSICTNLGASMAFTEMVSCDGIIRNGDKTINLMLREENEKYFAVQVFTADPEIAHAAVAEVLKFKPDVIDLNCGCPVPKVVKNGAGSALMKDTGRLNAVVAALTAGISEAGAGTAVSVKIRSGWDNNSLNFIEAARSAVDAGASMVSLHSRTRSQSYSGKANWDHLKELKDSISVPVIGSGDLFSPEAALEMFEKTNCDGLMFSRGALGNPWIFEQTINLLSTGTPCPPPGDEERIKLAFRHLEAAVAFHGEDRACREIKKHLCSYTKGTAGAAELRNRIVHASRLSDYNEIFSALL